MQAPETRATLIVRLRDPRNERAWNEFVAGYEPFLRCLVERRGVPSRDVPDVTQQVLAAIAHSVSGWRDDGQTESFRRWVQRVARNVVIKFMTRERKQVEAQGGTEFQSLLEQQPAAEDQDQQRRYEYELVVWAAQQVRQEFRESSWKAFWATLVEGRSVSEVAQELGVTPGSIYMSRSRIMARIQTIVSEVLDEPA